jgi:hypothetical protein
MSEQPYPQTTTTFQGRLAGIGLFASYCMVALAIAFLVPHKDFVTFYMNVLASFSMLGGVLGLVLVLFRLLRWPLPSFLKVPEEERDTRWRLLALALIAIAMPLLMIVVRHGLLHQ